MFWATVKWQPFLASLKTPFGAVSYMPTQQTQIGLRLYKQELLNISGTVCTGSDPQRVRSMTPEGCVKSAFALNAFLQLVTGELGRFYCNAMSQLQFENLELCESETSTLNMAIEMQTRQAFTCDQITTSVTTTPTTSTSATTSPTTTTATTTTTTTMTTTPTTTTDTTTMTTTDTTTTETTTVTTTPFTSSLECSSLFDLSVLGTSPDVCDKELNNLKDLSILCNSSVYILRCVNLVDI
eukprot:m.214360 g.214360  ORF g.214360 m.214360 type:complete len:240 (-) comp15866_c0_seq10:2217-2936(-)